ncbi:hypothetical protein DPMN_154652 [Dreissena polymorpha]|uniref:Uncharacterized protein n=1 Tax=Dreissena polymorpha TaxID=45954 RepID=A0A9D4FLF0_DREPO|nr:hypothetical protein DPMN_154652 [Dreissena polymorpha]
MEIFICVLDQLSRSQGVTIIPWPNMVTAAMSFKRTVLSGRIASFFVSNKGAIW